MERGAFAGRVFQPDTPDVLQHDAVNDRQAESGPFADLFCSEEGVEYFFPGLLRNAVACVANLIGGICVELEKQWPGIEGMALSCRALDRAEKFMLFETDALPSRCKKCYGGVGLHFSRAVHIAGLSRAHLAYP